MVAIGRQAFAEDISAANGGSHFSSTLADHRRIMFAIEPLSQSDSANFQLLLFRLAGTHSRVSLFAAPTFLSGERKCHEYEAGMFRSTHGGHLSELQKRMTIREVRPILLVDGFEDVTYRCKSCRSEMKRTFKRCSGAWEPVTLPSFSHFDRSQAKPGLSLRRNA